MELRPDLGQPGRGSMPALAARAISRQSVKVAADDLDFLRLAILDVLMTMGADDTAVPVAEVLTRLGGAPTEAALAALADLRTPGSGVG